jgi:DNA polymerase alpha-associated DNA helicase A
MNQTMEKLKKMEERDLSTLIRVVFGLESPTKPFESPEISEGKIEFVDPTLNDSQKDAIRFALNAREIALIHGPPGVRYPRP